MLWNIVFFLIGLTVGIVVMLSIESAKLAALKSEIADGVSHFSSEESAAFAARLNRILKVK